MTEGRPTKLRRAPSFRLKLTLIAVLVAAVPIAGVGLVLANVNEHALGEANDEYLDAVVGNVGNLADVAVEQTDGLLSAVSVQLADASRDADTRIALAKAIVASSATSSGTLPAIGIYDETGKQIDVLAVSGQPSAIALPAQLAPELAKATAPAFGSTVFGGGHAGLLRVVPVAGAAQHWTAAAFISLDPLAQRAVELVMSTHPRDRILVVDRALEIVASSTGEGMGQKATSADAGVLATVSGTALENNLLVRGAFERADGEVMLGVIRSIEHLPFAVIVETPRADAFHSIATVRKIVLIAVVIAILAAVIVGTILARRVTQPIKSLVAFAGDLANRRFEQRSTVRSADEIGVLGAALDAAATELAASDERIRREVAIRSDLGRYLPVKLVDQIVARERDVSLGGERRQITVMFADVVGFTPLAERETAETVVTMLNELFTILTEIVFRHGGTVDKFVGDCVMAIWGAPDDQADHAKRALLAAEDMLRWLEAGNESWLERFGFSVELAIGINSGEAVVGNFGSETRMEYTAIGDAVNIAARLESIARPNQILVTHATRAAAGDVVAFRSLGVRSLVGKSDPVELFEVLV